MAFEPLDDRVVIEPMKAEPKTKGGIVLPDSAQEKQQRGTVVSVGPGRMDEDGKHIAVAVKAGDKIIYAPYGGMEIKIDDKEYVVLRETDILGRIV